MEFTTMFLVAFGGGVGAILQYFIAHGGRIGQAVLYIVLRNIIGLFAAWGSYRLGSAISITTQS